MKDSDYRLLRKVLFIGPHLAGKGGIASVLAAYRRNLPEFHMLATNSVRGTLPGLVNFARTLAALPLARLRGFRVLDVHGASGKSWRRKSLIVRLGRMLGYRVVYHMHGGGFRRFVEQVGVGTVRPVLAACQRTVFLTGEWKRYADTTFNLGNTAVLNNIVDTPAIGRDVHAPEPGPEFRFIYLGWFTEEKGVFDLLDVVSAHADYFRGRARLVLCGRYNEDRVRGAIAAGGVSDIVDFRGWVEGDSKDRALRESHVTVLPSYFEGLPVSLLESMTYAMPVIATRVGGIPEIVDDGVNGLLVEPGDKDALFEAMRFYVENPEAAGRHGRRGLERTHAYEPARVTADLMRILRDACGSREL